MNYNHKLEGEEPRADRFELRVNDTVMLRDMPECGLATVTRVTQCISEGRRLQIVTTGRSDWGQLLNRVLQRIEPLSP
jgi:hypothetical protein